MAKCPVCAAQIPDDFGLIECPSCSAQLIVHMDGRVEYSSGKESGEIEDPERPPPIVEKKKNKEEPLFEFREPEPVFDFENMPEGEPMELETPTPPKADPVLDEDANHEFSPNTAVKAREQEQPQDDILQPKPKSAADEPLDFEPTEQLPVDAPVLAAEPAEFNDNLVIDQAPTEVYRPDTPAQPKTPADSPDLSDIARFGNQASARDGSLRYNLHIRGIDTADMREAFREAITDRKLVWDIDQILRSLKNGEVKITNVPPAKAYIVISRLRHLPVQIDWEQYAVSQA